MPRAWQNSSVISVRRRSCRRPSARSVALEYYQLIDGFVIDHEDEAQIEGIRASGFDVIAAPTFMRNMEDRANLAKIVLDFAAAIRAGRTEENVH